MSLNSSVHSAPGALMRVDHFPGGDDVHRHMITDQLTAMLRQELSYTSTLSPQQHALGSPTSLPRDEWRRKICEWSYKVVDHFKYDREVVSVSMNYFDRFLVLSDRKNETAVAELDNLEKQRKRKSSQAWNPSRQACSDCSHYPCSCRDGVDQSPTSTSSSFSSSASSSSSSITSRTYQLAAMTALYLAIKLHAETGVDDAHHFDGIDECHHHRYDHDAARRRHKRKIKLLSFVELSRGQFSPKDLTGMERKMLEVLSWKVNPPTPMSLVTYLLRLFPSAIPIAPCRGPLMTRSYHSQQHQHYDLVLHVLHELSRYLTELSICLTEVSTAYPPSAIAYASILISLDMITTEALPVRIRHDFFSAVARASSIALDRGGANHSSGLLLVPHDSGITYLKRRIRNSFLPEMLLDNCGSGTTEHFPGQQQHPITIARDAGLLDMNALYDQDDATPVSSPNRRKNNFAFVHDPTMNGNDTMDGTSKSKLQAGSPVCVSKNISKSSCSLIENHRGSKRRNNGASSMP
uniref:Cyclin N-terminal domain-containing protein n=1 Tax=Ditylum brightwellii TaxID=49249 RepID=A0A7S4WBA6_9STRA|mmetsp:Transcript_36003/g.47650  ORF Transcript_36003/g.47650 Transcript_36003/m.47650 type:complete len:521 (-) Transcript_36003:242-1804(-)